MLEKLNWFHLTGLITLVLLMWKYMGLFLRKNHLLRCWSWLSLLNWIEALTLSLTKTASKKIGALTCFMKLLSCQVALYFYKSTIRPSMECRCYVWAGAPSWYLQLLDKLHICSTVGPSLVASFESLAHYQNLVSLSLFYRYYFNTTFIWTGSTYSKPLFLKDVNFLFC